MERPLHAAFRFLGATVHPHDVPSWNEVGFLATCKWAPAMTVDHSMIKLVARAHRWQQLLLQGVYTSIEEMAAAVAINPSCGSS